MKLKAVFLSMFLAAIAGGLTSEDSFFFDLYDLIGTLFLNALTLVVLPLVVSSIITGAMRLGKEEAVGRTAAYTFRSFFLTSFFSVIVALAIAITFSGISFSTSGLPLDEEASLFFRFKDILLSLVPSNLFKAAVQGKLLGMILFSLLFGFFITKLPEELQTPVAAFWRGTFSVMMDITTFIMKFLPIGVFGLMAKAVSQLGAEIIGPVLYFLLQAILGQLLILIVVLPTLLLLHGISPVQFYREMVKPLITAFTTSSTAATLPVTLETLEEKGVPNRICSFVLPLGTSMNLSGTAAYSIIAVSFLATNMGTALTPSHYMMIAFMGFFSAWGMVTGIPSASLILIVMILQSLGVEGGNDALALILPVERVLDMLRTSTNVASNASCAQMVNSVEKKSVIV